MFASLHGLDADVRFDLNEMGVEEATKKLSAHLQPFLSRLLDLAPDAGARLDKLDIDTLGALADYRRGTATKHPELKPVMRELTGHVLNGTFLPWRAWGSDTEP